MKRSVKEHEAWSVQINCCCALMRPRLLCRQGHRRPSGRCCSGVSDPRWLLQMNSPLSLASLREAHTPFHHKQVASMRANFHHGTGSRHEVMDGGTAKAQAPRAPESSSVLESSSLATWEPDHRGCLRLWAHSYLADPQGLSSSTLASLKSIIRVHPQHLENI